MPPPPLSLHTPGSINDLKGAQLVNVERLVEQLRVCYLGRGLQQQHTLQVRQQVPGIPPDTHYTLRPLMLIVASTVNHSTQLSLFLN